jgi:hypothetical protein
MPLAVTLRSGNHPAKLDGLNGLKNGARSMSDDDRDPQSGKFRKGNSGGPGRTRRAVEVDYLAVISESVPLERWKGIVDKFAEKAAAGDLRAAAWLAGFLVGPRRRSAQAGGQRARGARSHRGERTRLLVVHE